MISVDEKLRILQPILGTKKVMRLRQYYYFKKDSRDKMRIENHIDLLISRLAKKSIEEEIILPPPNADVCAGDIDKNNGKSIDIGKVEYLGKETNKFHLKLKDINRHVGVFGSTGSGKTTFARNLIHVLHKRNIPFLVFDWEKSYRSLVRELSGIRVFTVGSDINPLFLNFLTVPPGIKFDEYIKSIIAVISEDYVGGIGADTMLLNYMEAAFEETKHPFFLDLKDIVVREINNDKKGRGRLSGRSGLWKESVSRQITFMSKGAAGTIINNRKHYPLEKLFSRPIVLEFGNLKSPHDRKFFIHVILNWLSIYNQHCGIQSENLKQVLIFEEFHNIAMRGKEDNMVSNLFRESRKYGIGLIAIDQTPSEIPNSIFANMNVKMGFSLNTSRDITAMARAMNLDNLRAKYLGMLDTGQSIINVKQRYHDPFLLKPYFTQIDENMSDDELRKAMKSYKDEHIRISDLNALTGDSKSSQVNDTSSPLLPHEKILFANIIENPLLGVDKRSKVLGLHSSIMSDIHNSLEEKGIIKTETVDKKKLMELTSYGRYIATEEGFAIPERQTRGGIEHYYWIEQTVQFLKKQEFQPACEKFDIDITDIKNSIAIEIETGKSDIKKNLLKLARLKDSQVSNCFMLSTTRPIEFKIKEIAKDIFKDFASEYPAITNIKIMFISDFLKLTKDQIIHSSNQKAHPTSHQTHQESYQEPHQKISQKSFPKIHSHNKK